tara:strand:- start:1485 stop:1775 length:291 start_codon:yes stop_codon:yes gene_type:complete
MSRKSTPSPPIISKRRQNNVSNAAILQLVSKREPFMNINDLVKYISENPTFYNLPSLPKRSNGWNKVSKEITSTPQQVYKYMDTFMKKKTKKKSKK